MPNELPISTPVIDHIGVAGAIVEECRQHIIKDFILHFEKVIDTIANSKNFTPQEWWDRQGSNGVILLKKFAQWKQALASICPDIETASPLIFSTGDSLQPNQDGTVTVLK